MDSPIEPPRTLLSAAAHLGPGIILASSIVGSGELIATTRVGAEAGFVLLWLVLVGCAIKVPAQVEIGRNTLTWGRTPLAAFSAVPGPRLGGLGWLFWGWVVMTVLIVVQQGGILAGVAQTLAAAVPVTADGRDWNRLQNERAAARIAEVAEAAGRSPRSAAARPPETAAGNSALLRPEALRQPPDERIWALVVGFVTAPLLAFGRYRLIERVSIVLVGGFTLVTLAALALLQTDPGWRIGWAELKSGLVPSLPAEGAGQGTGQGAVVTALAALGIIGVGASELMVYPYWCLEKGYGRAVGPRDESAAWAERARGWMRVMQLDAWASMVVYTLVTVAFYLLGAATLGRLGLVPAGSEMVRTLQAMYEPVLGRTGGTIFLLGAFAVLYSTLFVAAAGNARMVVDGLVLGGWLPAEREVRERWTRWVAAAWVLAAMAMALAIRAPVAMVLAGGVAQAVMLAGLAFAVLFFRYRQTDARLTPTAWWDGLVWVSCAGFILIAAWTVWEKLLPLVAD
jgi:Mn2+/Fe2+ NRAMP family transporter